MNVAPSDQDGVQDGLKEANETDQKVPCGVQFIVVGIECQPVREAFETYCLGGLIHIEVQ